MEQRKKLLFIINTLGGAGAENALIGLMERLKDKHELYLFVLMGQGELIGRVPDGVKLLNKRYSPKDLWKHKGRLYAETLRLSLSRASFLALFPYIVSNFFDMAKKRRIQPDKLMWRVAARGARRYADRFDLAVAFIEGGSAYYTADYVNAAKKAAFVHIDYQSAGYCRRLDRDCYEKFDRVFTVSDEVRTAFLKEYPEHAEKTFVFRNVIDRSRIKALAEKAGGFSDGYDGPRILTVGRLTEQKAYDKAIEAMYVLKNRGIKARWYVLGEGDARKKLEQLIAKRGLENDFLLPGAVENPFPYYKQADLYVHATAFEGKSVAVQEAMTLGCAVLVSDVNGNREQVNSGVDGRLCRLVPESIADEIAYLLGNEEERLRLGRAAAAKLSEPPDMFLLKELLRPPL